MDQSTTYITMVIVLLYLLPTALMYNSYYPVKNMFSDLDSHIVSTPGVQGATKYSHKLQQRRQNIFSNLDSGKETKKNGLEEDSKDKVIQATTLTICDQPIA